MSKEINTILSSYHDNGKKYALATVVNLQGSSYRRMGARMLISEDGTFVGGISGGCLEGDALKKAQISIYKNQASLVQYDTNSENEKGIGVGLGCNGIIDILFTPFSSFESSPLKPLSKIQSESRQKHSFITITKSDDLNILGKTYCLDENIPEYLYTHLDKWVNLTQSTFIELDNSLSVFLEIILPTPKILIFGSNYDVYPIIDLCKILGWPVKIISPISKIKPEYRTYGLELSESIDLDSHTAVLLMSHSLNQDTENLKNMWDQSMGYMGILGPKSRSEKILNLLNFTSKPNLFFPMGLDIGAESPEEIALAILSEIKSYFASRNGGFLKNRRGKIYDNA
ncbi:MAG: XdhC family protein [Leadbetterella sp.]